MTTTSRLSDLMQQIGADQRNRWLCGDRRRVEAYLQESPELASDRDGLLNLVLAEYWLRQDVGDNPSVDEFVSRFPELETSLRQTLGGQRPTVRGLGTSCLRVDAQQPTALHNKGLASANPPSTEQPFETASVVATGNAHSCQLPQITGYRIARELGRGMGVVYEAYDVHRDRWVALKTIRTPDDPRALQHFKQEFRTLCDVLHPNLVNLYELVSDGNMWFFTMELIAGVDFLTYVRDDKVAARGSLNDVQVQRLRSVLVQLVRGVNAVHQFGKLHRDLKPGNVFVRIDGRVVILDFGLAASLDAEGLHQVTEQYIVGTLLFMAPEQAAGDVVSPASDWYCLGVMLYQALTGKLPFEGKPLSVLQRKQLQEPEWDASVDAPDDLIALCMDLLKRDAGARPNGREILERLGDVSAPLECAGIASRHPRSDSEIVGREAELEVLRRAFAAVQDGGSRHLFICGPSGFGKSSLIKTFLREIEDGAWVFRGRCFERELVPYKAVDSLIDALCHFLTALPAADVRSYLPRHVDALATLFPVLRRVPAIASVQRAADSPDPAELRRRGFVALRELFARLGDTRPVVVAIDDVQWGDSDSEQLLAELVQVPDAPRMLLLLIHRQEDASESPFLQAVTHRRDKLLGWDNAEELCVASLLDADIRRLVGQVVSPDDPRFHLAVEAALREAGGSPLFVVELAWSILSKPEHVDLANSETLTLDDVLWRRVKQLSPACRRLMETIAVASRPIRASLAYDAADVGGDERAALDELRLQRLIRISEASLDESVESYHDRVRESVIGNLTDTELERRHRRLAQAMASLGSIDPEVVADHWRSAGELQMAGPLYARAAARAADALAFDRAAQLYRRVLDNPALAARDATALKVQLGQALANAGRGGEAALVYQEAASESTDRESRRLRGLSATQFLLSGHVDAGLEAIEETLRPLGSRLPRSINHATMDLVYQTIRLKCRGLAFHSRTESTFDESELEHTNALWSASIGLGMVNPMYASLFVKKHLRVALNLGEPKRIAQGLAYEAVFYGTLGPRHQSSVDRYLAMADNIGRSIGDNYVTGFVALARGITEYSCGRFQTAHAHCVQSLQVFQDHCVGAVWEDDTASIYSAWSRLNAGSWQSVFDEIDHVTRVSDARQDLYLKMNWVDFVGVHHELARDAPTQASFVLDAALDRWSRQGFFLQHVLSLLFRVYIELYRGEGARAWQLIDANWSHCRSASFHRIHMTRVLLNDLRGRASLAAARDSTGLERKRRIEDAVRASRALARERSPWANAVANVLDAQVLHLRGDFDGTLTKLRQARQTLKCAGIYFASYAAQRQEGLLLGGGDGKLLVQDADDYFVREGVRTPERIAAMHAPAFYK